MNQSFERAMVRGAKQGKVQLARQRSLMPRFFVSPFEILREPSFRVARTGFGNVRSRHAVFSAFQGRVAGDQQRFIFLVKKRDSHGVVGPGSRGFGPRSEFSGDSGGTEWFAFNQPLLVAIEQEQNGVGSGPLFGDAKLLLPLGAALPRELMNSADSQG